MGVRRRSPGCAARPRGDRRDDDRRLSRQQPDRLQRRPGRTAGVQRVRADGSPWRAQVGGRCARASAPRRDRRAVRGGHVPGSRRARRRGAVFVDIGGGTTDVALVRGGGISGTKMLALGGRAFTKGLAERLGVSFADAETAKLSAADGSPDVADALLEDARIWRDGVELMIGDLAGGDLLPGASCSVAAGPTCHRFDRSSTRTAGGSASRSRDARKCERSRPTR